MAYSTDPVGNGLVASLVRPGGNITGLASSSDDSSPKQLELLASVVPNVSRIGVLGNPATSNYSSVLKSAQDAAKKVGLSIVPMEARSPQEIENAVAALAKEGVPAVMFPGDAVFFGQRQRIAELALANHLATMFAQREYVVAGGLMSYGENLADFFRRAASYVDKIFKGATPGELPIEQPARFDLVINRKTADALGVTIPAQLYIFAAALVARASGLMSIPDDLSSVNAAPLLCAGLTTFSALRNAPAKPGNLVAVLGIGGLGHLGVQYARHMGFKVAAIARGADKAELRCCARASPPSAPCAMRRQNPVIWSPSWASEVLVI